MNHHQILLLPFLFWLFTAQAFADELVVHQVQVAPVLAQDVDETLHVYGKVSFDDAWLQNINLAYSGQVVRLPVLAGEPVAKGQLLAVIAVDPAAATAYEQAVSAVQFSESELSRIQALLADQLATQSQLAAASKALTDNQTQLHQLKQQGLGNTIHEIRADFDAVVAAVAVQSGQRIPAGTTLMQLGHPDRLKVLLGVEAEDVHWMSSGNDIQIHPAMNPNISVAATIDKVLHTVNPQTRLADVLVRLSHAQTKPFLSGMTVSADVSARVFSHALIVPRLSVMYDNLGAPYVMRVEVEKVKRVPVTVLLEKEQHALVQGEISVGQQVVTVGVAELGDGDTIGIMSQQ